MMFFASHRGFIYFCSIPTLDLICLVGVSQENTPLLSVCDYSLSWVVMVCLLGMYGLSW